MVSRDCRNYIQYYNIKSRILDKEPKRESKKGGTKAAGVSRREKMENNRHYFI